MDAMTLWTNYLFCFRFSLQLMVSESVFVVHMKRRDSFWLRLVISILGYFLVTFSIVTPLRMLDSNIFLSISYYLMFFALTMVVMWICFDAKFKDIIFAGTGGYATQHIAFAIQTMIKHFTGTPENLWVDNIVFRVIPYIIVSAIVYIAFIRPAQNKGELKNKDFRMILIALVMLLSATVLSAFADRWIWTGIRGADAELSQYDAYNKLFAAYQTYREAHSIATQILCRSYAIICCLLILFMQFGLFRQNKLKRDNQLMEHLLALEKEQHQISKENIDIINIKCHDLKHQISALKSMDTESRQKSIEELEKSVMIYDSMVKTGNDALDLVLMEKSLICDSHKIKFSYMIDGKQLAALSTPDIYSLFGNAIDNAIENVVGETDEEKRIISLSVRAQRGMLMIHVENYCRAPVSFVDGLPVTTKADKNFHGFGTRSIEYIVKKYGGDVRMSAVDDNFYVDIIMPI